MKPVGGAKIPRSAKLKFYLLYLHFIFRSFLCIDCENSALIVKIRGIEKLLNNVFGYNVEQPSSWLDVNRTLRYVDQSKRLFIHGVA